MMQIRSVTFLSSEFEDPFLPAQTPSSAGDIFFAGLGSRLLAVFFDSLVMMAFCVVLRMVTASFQAFNFDDVLMSNIQLYGTMMIFLLYFGTCEVLMKGKTPGKILLGIHVVNNFGEIPSVIRLLIRNLTRVIDVLAMGLGLGMILKTKRQQRLGDWIAGTQVVRLARVPGAKPSNLLELFQDWGLIELKAKHQRQNIPASLVARINSLTRRPHDNSHVDLRFSLTEEMQ